MDGFPNPGEARGHARLAPSAAYRWLACPGSVALAAGRDTPNVDAARGTLAHMVAHHCFSKEEEAWEHIGTKAQIDGLDVEFTADDAPAVQKYLEYGHKLVLGGRGVSYEKRVQVSPEVWGTADLSAYSPYSLEIVDYKHGYLLVEPEENPQLKTYALGLLAGFQPPTTVGFKSIRLTIVQPRSPHPQGPIRSWDTSVEALRIWEKNVLLPGAELALSENAPRHTGSHCRFCPARTVCPELAAQADFFVEPETKDRKADFAAPVDIPDARVGELLQKCEVVSFLHKALQDEAFSRLNRGAAIPGYKLVHKKSDRVFKEGALPELEKELGAAIYDEPKLKTPAALEKLPGGKALVTRLAYRPDTGLTLAPESDKREGVKRSAKEVFADVVDQQTGD